ncbi:MAG: transposase, partial [Bacteroidales bacterium]|nr:transposase [Bacteroidales bacterium]
HYNDILNFYVNRSSNAAAESFNAKIKAFRASLRGVVDEKYFLFRLAIIYAYPHKISAVPMFVRNIRCPEISAVPELANGKEFSID